MRSEELIAVQDAYQELLDFRSAAAGVVTCRCWGGSYLNAALLEAKRYASDHEPDDITVVFEHNNGITVNVKATTNINLLVVAFDSARPGDTIGP